MNILTGENTCTTSLTPSHMRYPKRPRRRSPSLDIAIWRNRKWVQRALVQRRLKRRRTNDPPLLYQRSSKTILTSGCLNTTQINPLLQLPYGSNLLAPLLLPLVQSSTPFLRQNLPLERPPHPRLSLPPIRQPLDRTFPSLLKTNWRSLSVSLHMLPNKSKTLTWMLILR